MPLNIITDDFGTATETLGQAAYRAGHILIFRIANTSSDLDCAEYQAQLAELNALYPYNAACRAAKQSPRYDLHPNFLGKYNDFAA